MCPRFVLLVSGCVFFFYFLLPASNRQELFLAFFSGLGKILFRGWSFLSYTFLVDVGVEKWHGHQRNRMLNTITENILLTDLVQVYD